MSGDWPHQDAPTGGRDAFVAAINELRQRVASVHERVACPACGAPLGEACHSLGRGPGHPLKSAHSERLRADGITQR